MPNFSPISESRLITCHPDIVKVIRTAIQIKDFGILCGQRGQAAQHKAFVEGASHVDWPAGVKIGPGKHNAEPLSDAIDVWSFDTVNKKLHPWTAVQEQYLLAGIILACAYLLDVPMRWGHDWNNNKITTDEGKKLVDMPHFELLRR